MSLAIEIDAVTHVLLLDGWHAVEKDSFDLDAYEYLDGEQVRFGGGSHSTIPSTGARWIEKDGNEVCCSISSILAVKVSAAKKEKKRNEIRRERMRSYGD